MIIKSEKHFNNIDRYPDMRTENFYTVCQIPFHSFAAKTYYISNFKDFNTITPNLL